MTGNSLVLMIFLRTVNWSKIYSNWISRIFSKRLLTWWLKIRSQGFGFDARTDGYRSSSEVAVNLTDDVLDGVAQVAVVEAERLRIAERPLADFRRLGKLLLFVRRLQRGRVLAVFRQQLLGDIGMPVQLYHKVSLLVSHHLTCLSCNLRLGF